MIHIHIWRNKYALFYYYFRIADIVEMSTDLSYHFIKQIHAACSTTDQNGTFMEFIMNNTCIRDQKLLLNHQCAVIHSKTDLL